MAPEPSSSPNVSIVANCAIMLVVTPYLCILNMLVDYLVIRDEASRFQIFKEISICNLFHLTYYY